MNAQIIDYPHLSLAGLLHDVGKLGQRAHQSGDGLSSDTMRLEGLLCPLHPGGNYYSHKHILYTYEFISLIREYLPEGIDPSHLALLASRHHRPENELDHLLSRADYLASGMERPVDVDTYEETSDHTSFRKIRLYPILARIGQGELFQDTQTHKVEEWGDDCSILFPQRHQPDDLTSAMRVLWDNLLKRVEQNGCRDFWSFYTRLYTDLEATTWSVPAATNVKCPDVSLFDHSRAVSVIAGCLALAENKEEPFILVAGDFSGIQGFIYDLKYVEEAEDDESRRGYARRLRGRSLGVRLFVEQAALHFLKQQGLTIAHRIMSAGGKLYLLLPNNPTIQHTLEELRRQIEDWSLTRSHGRIRFNLTWITATNDDLIGFPQTISRLNSALAEAAQRGFSSLLASSQWKTERFLLPQIVVDRPETSGDPFKNIDREWGGRLPKSSLIALNEERAVKQPLPFARVEFIGSQQPIPGAPDLLLLLKGSPPSPGLAYQRTRIARHVPTLNDELLTFQEIADKARGQDALGFIKADVDNMGKILRFGFRKRDSFSHIATLSRMMEGFFGGYVEDLVRKEFPDIYLVYSGGDDLAAVGPWDRSIEFILRLRSEFGRFVCGNPSWGLSAGICISHHHTPILAAMEEADRLLEAAKGRRDGDGRIVKDALNVFGEVLSWQNAERGMETARKILNWIANEELSSGQVRRLLGYARQHALYLSTGNNNYLRYITDLVWDLERNWKEKSESLSWAKQFRNPSCPEFQWLLFSLKFTLMAVRNKET